MAKFESMWNFAEIRAGFSSQLGGKRDATLETADQDLIENLDLVAGCATVTLAHQMGAPTRIVQIAGRWNDILQVEQYTRALRPEDFAPYAPVSRLMNGR